jgi:hypothetical protein
MFSLPFTHLLGDRCSMFLGALGYTLYQVVFILPFTRTAMPKEVTIHDTEQGIYTLMLVTSIFSGAGAGISWVA